MRVDLFNWRGVAMSSAVIIFGLLVARILLDLMAIRKPKWQYDAGYALIFGMAASVLLYSDWQDVFGYICALLSIGYFVKLVIDRRRSSSTCDQHPSP
jgi:hypothetical protein